MSQQQRLKSSHQKGSQIRQAGKTHKTYKTYRSLRFITVYALFFLCVCVTDARSGCNLPRVSKAVVRLLL